MRGNLAGGVTASRRTGWSASDWLHGLPARGCPDL